MDDRATPEVDLEAPEAAVGEMTPTVPASPAPVRGATPLQGVLIALGSVAFLYFARPVLLPVVLACMAAMTLRPLIRWASHLHVRPALSAAFVLALVMATFGVGFVQLGRPAMAWMNDVPQHMTEVRQRVKKMVPRWQHLTELAAAVQDLGATEDEKVEAQRNAPTVEVKDSRGASSILNWTGTLLVGIGETLVLAYLLLASGDQFLQKLVHVMPTWRDKKRAVEISHEVQQNISLYLFSVSLINLALGLLVAGGLYCMGVPKAAMWGMLAAILNFVPYFGPVVGVTLLAVVGLLTFDSLWLGLLPPGWYLLLHLLESNFVAPVLLGLRFTLNPVVIFVSLIFWTWLWGIPGALLSVPILVSVKVVCDRVDALSSVSEALTSLPKH
jgi:predicted PurR-regulated permease PerM